MSNWREGLEWTVKQQGRELPQWWWDNKLNIHLPENVTRKDAAIEMYDLLCLRQMDRQMRDVLVLTEASGLNYTGLSGIKWRAPIFPKLLRM